MTGQPTANRADPLAGLEDLTDFEPRAQPKPRPAPEQVRAISEGSGFPSRAPAPKKAAAAEPKPVPPPRRRRTGRNVQVNVKVTPATAERLAQLSDAKGWAYGETLEHALEALAAAQAESGSR